MSTRRPQSWFQRLSQAFRDGCRRRHKSANTRFIPLRLEGLEDRVVPSAPQAFDPIVMGQFGGGQQQGPPVAPAGVGMDSGGAAGVLTSSGNLQLNPFGQSTAGIHQIVPNVKIQLIFLSDPTNHTSVPAAEQTVIKNYFTTILSDGFITNLLGQYGNTQGLPAIGNGSVGVVDTTASASPDTTVDGFPAYSDNSQTSDFQLENIIQGEITNGHTAASDGLDNLYFIFTPPGDAVDVGFGENSINAFLGYHSAFTDSGHPANLDYYAVIPDESSVNASEFGTGVTNGQRGETVVSSHQMAETITDDDPSAGWVNPVKGTPGGGEVGDQAANEYYVQDGHEVQYLWSNALIGPAHAPSTGADDLFINQVTPPAVPVSTSTIVPIASFTTANTSLTAANFSASAFEFDTTKGNPDEYFWTVTSITGGNGHFVVNAEPDVAVTTGTYGLLYAQQQGLYVTVTDTSAADATSVDGGAPTSSRYAPFVVTTTSPLEYTTDAGDYTADSGAHNLVLKEVGGNFQLTDNGNIVFTQPIALTTGIVINGDGDPAGVDNSLTIDYSGGAFSLPVTFDGGNGSGTHNLTLQGGTFTNETDTPGANSKAGTLNLDAETVNFTNVNGKVTDTNTVTNLTVKGTAGADTFDVVAGASGTTEVNGGGSPTFATIDYSNKTNVTVDGLAGSNTYNVTESVLGANGITIKNTGSVGTNPLTVSSNATGPLIVDVSDTKVTSTSGGPVSFTGVTALTVSGTSGLTGSTGDLFNVTPSTTLPITISGSLKNKSPGEALNYLAMASNSPAPTSGTITGNGFQTVTYSGIDSVNTIPVITSGGSTTFTVGTAGSFTVTDAGVTNPTLTESPALPLNLTFAAGVLGGTPAAGTAGVYTLTFTASTPAGSTTQTFTLTVVNSTNIAPQITSAASATFTVGINQSFTATATGSPTPTFSESGALPANLSFTPGAGGTGVLSGTPAAGTAGNYTLTFTAANGVGSSATQTFTLTVDQVAAVTSASSATFTVGTSGSFTATSTGAPTPTVSESGALPANLSFTPGAGGTGVLSGTPAAGTAGNYTLTLTASNGVGSPAVQTFTLTVDQIAAITSAGSATFTVGTSGSFTATSTGAPTPTVSESGALPANLSFAPGAGGTGVLSGTPAAGTAGNYTLTFTASNGVGSPATQTFTLTVDQVAAITSASSATFTVGTSGSFTATSTGAPTPTVSESGALPANLSFTPGAGGTGVLSGTPAAGTAGNYTLTFTASNGVGNPATQTFTLTVVNSNTSAPQITSAGSATFTVGTSGSFTATTTGNPTPTVSESGGLPANLSFAPGTGGTGVLSGTPAAGTAGNYTLTFTASNGVGSPATQTFTLTVDQKPAITSAGRTTFTVGTSGSFTATSTGNPTPTVSESGALPANLSFTPGPGGTGVLSGTPAAGTAGDYTLTFTASNGVGSPATQTFTLVVDRVPVITSAASATFTVGTSGSFTATAVGRPTPTVSESGALPANLSFTPGAGGTGVLSGTPAAGTAGNYTLTFTASNGVGSPATQTFTLTVDQVAAITSGSSATFTVGTSGSFTATATGNPTPTVSESGALPSNLSFIPGAGGTGVLSGTPAAGTAGNYTLTFTASNGLGSPATQTFTLTVDQIAAITSAATATFTVGTSGSFTATSTGAPTPTVSESGGLPANLSFTPGAGGTGVLSGTPAAGTAGNYTITFTASNGVGSPTTQTFTLTVDQVPAVTSAASATFTVGINQSFTATSTGNPTPTVSESGALPANLSFTPGPGGTGILSGTPAAGTAGNYTLTFTASNGVGSPATQTFTLTVLTTAITSSNTAYFAAGKGPTSFTITTTGFTSTPLFSESGALPSGVTLNPKTGVLSGTPPTKAVGTYYVTIFAAGAPSTAEQVLTIIVGLPQSPTITSAASATLTASASGSFTVTDTGFQPPTLSESGALPTGVTFNASTGVLAATPSAAPGEYTLTFTASNAFGFTTQTFVLSLV